MVKMKKLIQLNRHDPDKGIYGDCFRTAIACILDCESPEEIPLFAPVEDQKKAYVEYLDSIGYVLFEIPFNITKSIKAPLLFMQTYYPNFDYILAGVSSRGIGHVSIYRGDELIHDPHPSGGGILSAFPEGNVWYEIGIIFPKPKETI